MSAFFTLTAPPRDPDPAVALVIEDRWRVTAFGAPLLWALWSRSWLLAVAVALVHALRFDLAVGGDLTTAAVLELGLRAAMGFEAAEAARLDRRLRGWRELGGVDAADAEAAVMTWTVRRAGAERSA